jgi:aldose 1-epimerase
VRGTKVVLSYDSRDGEEGFPGNVLAHVTYQLTNRNEFLINFEATSTKPTFINLTNHSYFNLAGHNKGSTDVDDSSIPTGKLLPVAGTIFDLQVPKVLGDVIHRIPGYSGYDHNFCINRGRDQGDAFIAR